MKPVDHRKVDNDQGERLEQVQGIPNAHGATLVSFADHCISRAKIYFQLHEKAAQLFDELFQLKLCRKREINEQIMRAENERERYLVIDEFASRESKGAGVSMHFDDEQAQRIQQAISSKQEELQLAHESQKEQDAKIQEFQKEMESCKATFKFLETNDCEKK
ncbi:hypothetical protein BS50DRAFT_587397 [Corynespora cassiicola Philippines]|uniref:Uncharacterized protein n=1 Tax=Corynespora cassiicola Philippines TaxID=1448308 RepID=A0A2T2NSE4_CORCC|nr:hypothetical protein BS50DRAFT_587397 [Corynespora cassiicola Philippines]